MRFVVLVLLAVGIAAAQSPGPEQLFREGVAAQQRGDDATAISKYQQLLKLRPDVVEVRANLGAALAREGRLDEAIEQYKIALAKSGSNAGLRLNLALAYYKKGSFADAIKELKVLHGAEPQNARVAILLADSYTHLRQDDQVVAVLKPVKASPPDDLTVEWMLGSALIRTGQLNDGFALVQDVAKRGNSAEAYLLAGETALKLNDFERARDDADAAVRLNEKLPGALTLKGKVLQYLGENAGASEALQKALVVNPDDFEAQLNLGAVLQSDRDLAGARQHLEKALQLNPKSVLALYAMAKLERSEGKLEDAVRDLEKVIRDDPKWAQPHVELSALYFRLNRQADGEREKEIFDRLNAQQEK